MQKGVIDKICQKKLNLQEKNTPASFALVILECFWSLGQLYKQRKFIASFRHAYYIFYALKT